MKRFPVIVAVCTAVAVLLTGCGGSPPADLVIHGGPIYTVDDARPSAGLVAVRDGRIVHVGDAADSSNWIGTATRVIDLNGRTLIPGFVEGHGHFYGTGLKQLQVDLTGTGNYAEVVERVAAAAAELPAGTWIEGRGWHQSKWDPPAAPMVKGFPVHDALSAAVPDHPVYIKHASGHAALVNATAMTLAGIDRSTPDPAGGEIIRDARGNPTGLLNEKAAALVSVHIPVATPEKTRRVMDQAMAACLEHGVTSFVDAGTAPRHLALMEKMAATGELSVRLYVMLDSDSTALLDKWYAQGPAVGLGDGFLTVRAVKLRADGALGSRGAWLLADYSDRSGHHGHETTPMDSIEAWAERALLAGFQVGTHAIGDRANREVLDRYEAVLKRHPDNAGDHRFRIEHAQHLSAADIPRFAELGVIPAMQAIHMASDRPWAIDRLGIERIEEGAYVWRKLLTSGACIVNGTDVPVEPISPIACFYASVTRRTLAGDPPGGYEPDQRMTRAEALRSYTLDAAYGSFEEDVKGSIEVGKYADFAVLSQDILTVPDDALLDTRVEMTIVDGVVRYERR